MTDDHAPKFVLVSDDDGHWYVCPKGKRGEAERYFEAVADFWSVVREEGDDTEPSRPDWLDAVGGAPSLVEFSNYTIG